MFCAHLCNNFVFCFLVSINNILFVKSYIMPDITKHPNWYLMDHEKCGLSVSMDRIIGGKNASLGQFPWLARIGYSVPGMEDEANFRCGGSLINKIYVLTAAHCATNLPGKLILSRVRLGEHFVNSKIDCEENVCAEPVQDFSPITIIVHKDYGNPVYKNDIALIRLDRPVNYNWWVMPICLPSGSQLMKNYVGTLSEVAGWGIYDLEKPKASNYLLYVKLPIVEMKRCVEAFKKYASLDDKQLCVGGVVGEDSCGGDSGGPLMKVEAVAERFDKPRYYTLGIVSFGAKRCGGSTMPAVYTKISAYLEWVLDNMVP